MTHRPFLYLMFAALGTSALGQTSPIPHTPDGKPDFSGYFNIQDTPNMAMGKEDLVPYTPAGKAAYADHDAKDGPTSNGWLPGVPRIMQSPYPSQFVQTPTHLINLFVVPPPLIPSAPVKAHTKLRMDPSGISGAALPIATPPCARPA